MKNPVPELQAAQEETQREEITPVWPGLVCAWHSPPGTAVPRHKVPHQMWPLVAFHNSLVLSQQ